MVAADGEVVPAVRPPREAADTPLRIVIVIEFLFSVRVRVRVRMRKFPTVERKQRPRLIARERERQMGQPEQTAVVHRCSPLALPRVPPLSLYRT